MTDLDDFLAREVMGWVIAPGAPGVLECYSEDVNGEHYAIVMVKADWSPTANIRHALKCVSAIPLSWWAAGMNPDGDYYCNLFSGEPDYGGGYGQSTGNVPHAESLSMAISLACAKARGWKERQLDEAMGGMTSKGMSGETALLKDHPLLTLWEEYKATEDYQNTRRWALHEKHVDGSLWAAFVAGYESQQIEKVMK